MRTLISIMNFILILIHCDVLCMVCSCDALGVALLLQDEWQPQIFRMGYVFYGHLQSITAAVSTIAPFTPSICSSFPHIRVLFGDEGEGEAGGIPPPPPLLATMLPPLGS